MFLSKYKKKIKTLEDNIKYLYERMEEMNKVKKGIEKRQEQLERIIKYFIPGKVTCHRDDYTDKNNHIQRDTYIYKDFREYKFEGLALEDNSEFTVDDINHNLLVTIDELDKAKYIIDLNKCSFIKLPLKENK